MISHRANCLSKSDKTKAEEIDATELKQTPVRKISIRETVRVLPPLTMLGKGR